MMLINIVVMFGIFVIPPEVGATSCLLGPCGANGSSAEVDDGLPRLRCLVQSLEPQAWSTQKPITISVFNAPPGMSSTDVEYIAMHVATIWGDRCGAYFQLAPLNKRGNLDIVFVKIDGKGGTIGLTEGPYPRTSTPIFLDIDEEWVNHTNITASLEHALFYKIGYTLLGMRAIGPMAPNIEMKPEVVKLLERYYGRANGQAVLDGRAEPEDEESLPTYLCVRFLGLCRIPPFERRLSNNTDELSLANLGEAVLDLDYNAPLNASCTVYSRWYDP